MYVNVIACHCVTLFLRVSNQKKKLRSSTENLRCGFSNRTEPVPNLDIRINQHMQWSKTLGKELFTRPQEGQPVPSLVCIRRKSRMPISCGLAIEAIISWYSTWIRRFVAPWVEMNLHCSHITATIQNKFQIGPRSPTSIESGCISIFRGIQVKDKGFEIVFQEGRAWFIGLILACKFHSKKVFIPRGLFGFSA